MQAIGETIFDIVYLFTVIILGILMIRKSKGNKEYFLYGIMAIILGSGDSFHLVPRSYGLLTIGLEANAYALGIGKFITSITMTIFYLVLYFIWKIRYKIKDRGLDICIFALGIIRIILCLFPQNRWTDYDSPVLWGVIRNIPFLIMGIIIICLFFREAKKNKDLGMKYMWLAITLSFMLYIPVVLWADTFPIVGVLMIPKTIAYVWIVFMGYFDMKEKLKV